MTALDADLDALAPPPKRVKLGGNLYTLPGDMDMDLFLRIQGYEARVAGGEDQAVMLTELQGEVLRLFQEHQPKLTKLPKIGMVQLLRVIGAVYGDGAAEGEAPPPNRAARRAKKTTTRTTSAA